MLQGVTEGKVESPGCNFGSNNQNLLGLSQKHWSLGRPVSYLSIFCKGVKVTVMSINSSSQLQCYSLPHLKDNLWSHTISNCWTQGINLSWRLQLLQLHLKAISKLLCPFNAWERRELVAGTLLLTSTAARECIRLRMLMIMMWSPWRCLMHGPLPWEQVSPYCWSMTSKTELSLGKFCRSFELCPSRLFFSLSLQDSVLPPLPCLRWDAGDSAKMTFP